MTILLGQVKRLARLVRDAGKSLTRSGHGGDAMPVAGGLPLRELLPILYPRLDPESGLEAAACALLKGRDRVESLSDLRLILGSFDRQSYPSPVRVRLMDDQVLWHEEDGLFVPLDPQDPSVSAFIADDNFEPHVTAVLRQLCKPGWTVVDVGANLGYHTLHLSSLVGRSGSVIAVEANPENCHLIDIGVKANHLSNVRIVPCGLSKEPGWSYFSPHIGTNGGLLGATSATSLLEVATMVPLLRMDDIVSSCSRVDLIKVDVEGAEGLVLAGATETITHHRPFIVSEFSCEMTRRVSTMEPVEYLNSLADLGYRIHVIDRRSPGTLVEFASANDLLKSWPDEFHIEDLLFAPV